jgi:hypothetical protein
VFSRRAPGTRRKAGRVTWRPSASAKRDSGPNWPWYFEPSLERRGALGRRSRRSAGRDACVTRRPRPAFCPYNRPKGDFVYIPIGLVVLILIIILLIWLL